MSIIERDNPLNLQYNISIVTNASSPLGIRVCKALLKANALVLGVDTKPPPRDVLNSAQGTHFQFEEWGDGNGDRIVTAAKDKFLLDRLDLLVNIGPAAGEDTGAADKRDTGLAGKALQAMAQHGKGSLVSVGQDLEAKEAAAPFIELTNAMAKKYPQGSGVRCNVILPQASGGVDAESANAFGGAKEYMTELMQSKEENSKAHDVGLLVGWLASDMSGDVTGRTVRLDGSSSPL